MKWGRVGFRKDRPELYRTGKNRPSPSFSFHILYRGGKITFGGRENPALEIRPLTLLRRAVYTLCGTVMRPRWITVPFLLPGIKERGRGEERKWEYDSCVTFLRKLKKEGEKRTIFFSNFLITFGFGVPVGHIRTNVPNEAKIQTERTPYEIC